MKFLLDSVVLIDHLNGVAGASRFLRENGAACAVSAITRAEVLAGASASNEGAVTALLDRFVAIPVTVEIADEAARVRRAQGLKLPDALQVAVATLSKLTLVTRDRKIHRGTASLDVIRPYRV